MKRYVLLLTALIMASAAYSVAAGDTLPSRNNWYFGAGELRTSDPTLSPQEYNGPSFSFTGEHTNDYRCKSPVEWSFDYCFTYAYLLNESKSARMNYFALNLRYGSYYRFEPVNGLSIAAGGRIDLFGAVKNQTRNVNNIGAGDIRFNLDATARIRYQYHWNSRFGLETGYDFAMPFIGCMFMPDFGESYYEISKGLPGNLKRLVTFTSFHNIQNIKGILTFNILFPDGALIFAFSHENAWWQGKAGQFYTHNLTGSIGFALRLKALRI